MRKHWSSILAGGIFFLLPFLCNPFAPTEMQLEQPKLMGAYFAGNIFFSLYVSKKIHKWLGMCLFLFSFDVWWSGFGAMQMYGYAYFVTAVFVCLWFVSREEWEKKIVLHAILAAAILSSFMALMQLADHDPVFNYAPGIERTNPIAFLGQTTKFGAFLVMAFAISLAYEYALISLFLFIVCLTTSSSMVLFSLAAIIIVRVRRWNYGIVISRYLVGLGLGAIGLLLVVSQDSPLAFLRYSSGRYEIWGAAIKAWWNGPRWFGFGPGSFQVIFPDAFQPASTLGHGIFTRAHNDYVQVAFEFGILGLVLLALLYIPLKEYYNRFLWRPKLLIPKSQIACEGMLVAIMANAVGNFPWQLSPHYLLGMMSLSVLLKAQRDDITLRVE